MHINPKLIKKQFEKSFGKYNKNALVQKSMAEKLIFSLTQIKNDFNTILELGCGTGLLTEQAVNTLHFETYYANDIVETSNIYTSKILENYTFLCGNAQKIKPAKKTDLIISNAMFQWLGNLTQMAQHLHIISNPSGLLAFSTFLPDNYKEIRDLTGLSLDYKTIGQIKQELSGYFEIIYNEEYCQTLRFSNPLELLAHIKNTGVNALSNKHMTFLEVKEFCDKYKEKYPQITLTYNPAIIIAKKI